MEDRVFFTETKQGDSSFVAPHGNRAYPELAPKDVRGIGWYLRNIFFGMITASILFGIAQWLSNDYTEMVGFLRVPWLLGFVTLAVPLYKAAKSTLRTVVTSDDDVDWGRSTFFGINAIGVVMMIFIYILVVIAFAF